MLLSVSSTVINSMSLQLVSGVLWCCSAPSLMLLMRNWLLRCLTCLLLPVSLCQPLSVHVFVCKSLPFEVNRCPSKWHCFFFSHVRNRAKRRRLWKVLGSGSPEHHPTNHRAGTHLHTHTHTHTHTQIINLFHVQYIHFRERTPKVYHSVFPKW